MVNNKYTSLIVDHGHSKATVLSIICQIRSKFDSWTVLQHTACETIDFFAHNFARR